MRKILLATHACACYNHSNFPDHFTTETCE